MAWAVLVYSIFVVCLYVALDIVLPSTLRKRHKRPIADMVHEREEH